MRKWKIQKKYFLYFKYKIHVLYFVTFSGTSILYFILIHLFEGYFVFCIKIHFDVFLPISVYVLFFFLVRGFFFVMVSRFSHYSSLAARQISWGVGKSGLDVCMRDCMCGTE